METFYTAKAVTISALSGSVLITACASPAWAVVPGNAAVADRPTWQLAQGASYADGVYTATGQYGNEPSFITVRVRLAGGVITEVQVTTHATNPTSLDLQRRFAAAVPGVVVGKRIEDVNVGRLAGSSGTPRGFNAALRKVQEQARR